MIALAPLVRIVRTVCAGKADGQPLSPASIMRTVWRTVDHEAGLNVRAKALKNNIADVTDGADAKFPIGIAYSFCIPAWSA